MDVQMDVRMYGREISPFYRTLSHTTGVADLLQPRSVSQPGLQISQPDLQISQPGLKGLLTRSEGLPARSEGLSARSEG